MADATPLRPVAVDAMGGDDAPEALVAGAVASVRAGQPVLLIGDQARLRPLIPRGVDIAILHTDDAVDMEDAAVSVRRRPDSSLRLALQEVAAGRACAAVSCGHTGAALVGAVLDLGVLPGVERPAVATVLPRSDGGQLVLADAGANVDCRPEQLANFALLGAALAHTLGVEAPRVGLLANGSEPGKGNMQVRATLPLLQALPLDVVGNVEPPDAFRGVCDVLVCDGFAGNIMLKSVEGAAETVLSLLKEELKGHRSAQIGAWLLQRAVKGLRGKVAWESIGGGLLLGVDGVVVIGHGRSNAEAVSAAISLAARSAEGDLVGGLRARLGQDPTR
ncbi:MAG: phosphate acyltransferase PlsX [Deltaproteobacteria bacterium]|nr:MAG: phosphate acyltransferase PlsX [Deltaproteobacteria bacterium]